MAHPDTEGLAKPTAASAMFVFASGISDLTTGHGSDMIYYIDAWLAERCPSAETDQQERDIHARTGIY